MDTYIKADVYLSTGIHLILTINNALRVCLVAHQWPIFYIHFRIGHGFF